MPTPTCHRHTNTCPHRHVTDIHANTCPHHPVTDTQTHVTTLPCHRHSHKHGISCLLEHHVTDTEIRDQVPPYTMSQTLTPPRAHTAMSQTLTPPRAHTAMSQSLTTTKARPVNLPCLTRSRVSLLFDQMPLPAFFAIRSFTFDFFPAFSNALYTSSPWKRKQREAVYSTGSEASSKEPRKCILPQ